MVSSFSLTHEDETLDDLSEAFENIQESLEEDDLSPDHLHKLLFDVLIHKKNVE